MTKTRLLLALTSLTYLLPADAVYSAEATTEWWLKPHRMLQTKQVSANSFGVSIVAVRWCSSGLGMFCGVAGLWFSFRHR
jgi:hypothetical protein